ncbi:MAG: hypothetical protein AAFR99_11470 [Cyanobacteria bacterium J06629_9]
MFHLYFGALDVLLYAAAFIVAVMVSGHICDAEPQRPQLILAAASAHPIASLTVAVPETSPARRPAAQIVTTVAPTDVAPSQKTANQAAVASLATPTESASADPIFDKPVIRLAKLTTYKLHKKDVVRVSTLPCLIPDIPSSGTA